MPIPIKCPNPECLARFTIPAPKEALETIATTCVNINCKEEIEIKLSGQIWKPLPRKGKKLGLLKGNTSEES